MKFRAFLTGCILFFLFAGTASAKPPSVSVRVDKTEITVGEEVVYEVRVTHSPQTLIDFPEEARFFSPFELKRYRPLAKEESPRLITEGRRYVLTLFRLGEREIPPLTIFYTDYGSSGLPAPVSPRERLARRGLGVRKSVTTEPVAIRVKSVLGKEAPQGLDIQVLKQPEETLWTLLRRVGTVLFSVGALFLGAYAVVRLLPKPVPRILREDPVQAALRDLKALRKAWNGTGPTKNHYEALSGLLRRYLAGQFDPLTLDLTTSELCRQMSRYRPCRAIAEKVCRILQEADLVKFANRRGSSEEFQSFLKETEEVVRYTEPPPAPAGSS